MSDAFGGVPYPHPNPAPGSNSIGQFKIGVSPVGTISPFDIWQTVLSQYANSPAIGGMIEAFNAAMDQTQNLDNFYDMIWNIATAQGYGLDVWGRIVGVSRTLELPTGSAYLGFEEAGGSWQGFNQSPFYSGGSVTSNFNLTDSDFRTLILAKAAGNICDGSIPAINQILLTLFPDRGDCYVVDGENMTIEYKFDFILTPVETAILDQSGVLPTPVGVAATVVSPP